MNTEKRKSNRRKNFFTRSTDIYTNDRRVYDRRKSTKLKKEILSRIQVQAPYYALKNLEKIENGLKASIPIEQPLINETEPITVGETSRHLAILGSCAIALNRKAGKCYYLATKAIYKRYITKIDTKDLIGIAKVKDIEKRKAKAHTELRTIKNQVITSLDVEYIILSQFLFDRQFKTHKLDLRKKKNNPSRQNFYKQFNFKPKVAKQENHDITFNIGKIKPEMCMGHFPMYPALPVAFTANISLNLVSKFLQTILNNTNIKIVFKSIFVQALELIFVNIDLNIELKILERDGNKFIVSIKIIDKCKNKLLIIFSPVHLEVLGL
jgi:hypothetical protein